MLKLQPVTSDDEARLLKFEVENRTYFARSINDRGDDYFEHFAERHRELMGEQESGICAYHVLVDEDDEIVGRFNLYDLADGAASVGYRVGERFAGSGVATSGLTELCLVARRDYALRRLSATVSDENVASQRVLAKAGFVPKEKAFVAGKAGVRYELLLDDR